jgi:hypothetical protein
MVAIRELRKYRIILEVARVKGRIRLYEPGRVR